MPSLLSQARQNRDLPRTFVTSMVAGRRSRRRFDEVEAYCMFIGYPRSGHSLVGSLLDAHPDVAISHELDALRYFHAGFSRDQVFALILANERWYGENGRHWGTYTYAVPNQWQGRFRRLRVIGDKKGGRSIRRIRDAPELFERVRTKVRVPLRLVHVTRNPYDNIATMFAKNRRTLSQTANHYLRLCETVGATRAKAADDEVVDIRHESVVTDPVTTLRRLCRFLGLEADDAYLADCASILFPSPRQTRQSAPWTPGLVDDVQGRIAGFDFLDGYSFER